MGIEAASTKFVSSKAFFGEPVEHPLAAPLALLSDELDQMGDSGALVPKDVANAVKTSFSKGAADVVKSEAFTSSLSKLEIAWWPSRCCRRSMAGP